MQRAYAGTEAALRERCQPSCPCSGKQEAQVVLGEAAQGLCVFACGSHIIHTQLYHAKPSR